MGMKTCDPCRIPPPGLAVAIGASTVGTFVIPLRGNLKLLLAGMALKGYHREYYRMTVFTVDQADITGTLARIKGKEAHHLIRVHRVAVGEKVSVTDLHGGLYTGRVTSIDREVILDNLEKVDSPPPYPIHLFISLLKKDKMEWIVEKATELNIAAVHFVKTRFSVRSDISAEKWGRMERVATAAQKQCGRAYPLILCPPKEWGEVMADKNLSTYNHLFFSEKKETATLKIIWQKEPPKEPYALWIGPEGGWSEDEIREAEERRLNLVTLGPLILRAETAAISAISSVVTLI